MAINTRSLAVNARPMLRAWRDIVDDECSYGPRVSDAKAVFLSWSISVPSRTRQWARLFSKLDFERHRQRTAATAPEASAGSPRGGRPGVAKLFGANNPKELRNVFKDFMKDMSVDERSEMRFVLHAEAIRRGLGKYSIKARIKTY